MLLASTHETSGQPTVLAFGVKRTGGQYRCEYLYVAPTPGEDNVHTPLDAGPETFRYYPNREQAPTLVTIDWPGLTSGVPVGQRLHENTILQAQTEETT